MNKLEASDKFITNLFFRILLVFFNLSYHYYLVDILSISNYGKLIGLVAITTFIDSFFSTKSFEILITFNEKFEDMLNFKYSAFTVDFIISLFSTIIVLVLSLLFFGNILLVISITLFTFLTVIRSSFFYYSFNSTRGEIISRYRFFESALRLLLLFVFVKIQLVGNEQIFIAFIMPTILIYLYQFYYVSKKSKILSFNLIPLNYLTYQKKVFISSSLKSGQNGLDFIVLNSLGLYSLSGQWSIIKKVVNTYMHLPIIYGDYNFKKTTRLINNISTLKYVNELIFPSIILFVIGVLFVNLGYYFIDSIGLKFFKDVDYEYFVISTFFLLLGSTTIWWSKFFSLIVNPYLSLKVVLIDFSALLIMYIVNSDNIIVNFSILLVIPFLRSAYWWLSIYKQSNK